MYLFALVVIETSGVSSSEDTPDINSVYFSMYVLQLPQITIYNLHIVYFYKKKPKIQNTLFVFPATVIKVLNVTS